MSERVNERMWMSGREGDEWMSRGVGQWRSREREGREGCYGGNGRASNADHSYH